MSDTSMAYFGYRDAKDYANKIISPIYPKGCDRVKINKKTAVRQVELGHMAGEADTALLIMNMFIENVDQPYDIVLGELQTIIMERWNSLSKELVKKGNLTMSPVGVENLIKQSEEAIRKIRQESKNERERYRSDLARDAGEVKENSK